MDFAKIYWTVSLQNTSRRLLLLFTWDLELISINRFLDICPWAFNKFTPPFWSFCVFTLIRSKFFHFVLEIEIISFSSKFDVNLQNFLRVECNVIIWNYFIFIKIWCESTKFFESWVQRNNLKLLWIHRPTHFFWCGNFLERRFTQNSAETVPIHRIYTPGN